MTECCDIKAVVVPSAAVGTVLLTGAAELVGNAILDLGLETDFYQREVAQDGAGVTCVRVEFGDESPAAGVQRHPGPPGQLDRRNS